MRCVCVCVCVCVSLCVIVCACVPACVCVLCCVRVCVCGAFGDDGDDAVAAQQAEGELRGPGRQVAKEESGRNLETSETLPRRFLDFSSRRARPKASVTSIDSSSETYSASAAGERGKHSRPVRGGAGASEEAGG